MGRLRYRTSGLTAGEARRPVRDGPAAPHDTDGEVGMPETGDHAVVLGASMGGLLAARVLADAYRRVTIVERDPLPESVLDRKGVPQGRHAHGLLPARGADPR